jgi:two-component system response regulator MprA
LTDKILIVEDERNIASFVSMYLKKERYHVEIARDGAEALSKYDSLKPELIVLDLMLPDMEGWDFRTRQKKDPAIASIPVIGVSAVGKLLDVEYSFRKPLDYDQFLAAVEHYVGSGRRKRES